MDWWKNPSKNKKGAKPEVKNIKDDTWRATVAVIDENQDLYLMTFPNGETCEIILEFEFEFELDDSEEE